MHMALDMLEGAQSSDRGSKLQKSPDEYKGSPPA
jgi:hypothetical protein